VSDKDQGKIIEGHEYDGIKELDHPLPKWWVYLFYATIVYGCGYFAYYELLGGPSHKEQYRSAMAKIEAKKESVASPKVDLENIDPEVLMADTGAMKVGGATFTQYCAACHGQKGEGGIGPNLTDKFWIHSQGDFKGILAAIHNGFPTKGMPPWKDVINQDKHAPLVAYVMSLKGSNPANGKAPQGDAIE